MDILRVKAFAFAVCAALVVAPFVFWLFFYGLVRFSSIDLRRARPWLRALRWVTWISAMALLTAVILDDRLHYLNPYGCGLLSLSIGLSFTEGWLKRHVNLDSDNA